MRAKVHLEVQDPEGRLAGSLLGRPAERFVEPTPGRVCGRRQHDDGASAEEMANVTEVLQAVADQHHE